VVLEPLRKQNDDNIPVFGAAKVPCDAEIGACCFLRSFFLLACRFFVRALSCALRLPPRAIAKKTVGTSLHHGDMLRQAFYAAKRRHYISTNAAAANAHLKAAHLFMTASPNRIKTTDEILVHAPGSLGSYEQVHWVGNNPKWSEVMRQLTDLE